MLMVIFRNYILACTNIIVVYICNMLSDSEAITRFPFAKAKLSD